MYNNWQNSQLYAGPVTLLNLQRDMCNLPVIKVYRVTDVIRLFIFSLWDPLQLQTNRVLCAKLKNFNSKPVKSNFMLPTSIILGAIWLSVNHLTREPSKIGAKDSREKSMAASSFQVELLEHSEGPQSL